MGKLTSDTLFEHLREEQGIIRIFTVFIRYNSKLDEYEFIDSNNETCEQWQTLSNEQLDRMYTDINKFEKVDYDKNLLDNLQHEEVVFVLKNESNNNRHSVIQNGDDFYVHFSIHDTYVTVPFEREAIELYFIIGKWERAEKVDKFEETMKDIINLVKDEWLEDFSTGEQIANSLEVLLREKVHEYANVLGETELNLILNWENQRTKSVTETYTEGSLTSLHGREVHTFDTLDEWYVSLDDKGYRCPECDGVSDLSTLCTRTTCSWDILSEYTNLDKCVYVYIRETEQGSFNFKPIAWE